VFFVGEFGEVEGNVAFAGFGVLSVAGEAVLREDGTDVLVVGNLFFCAQSWGKSEGEQEAFWHDDEAELVEGTAGKWFENRSGGLVHC